MAATSGRNGTCYTNSECAAKGSVHLFNLLIRICFNEPLVHVDLTNRPNAQGVPNAISFI